MPLIVPEVNADAVAGFRKKNIIANPNCSTAQLVVALKPLHDKAKIKRVVVATYQSVSGAGKEAMDELFSQTKAVFHARRGRDQEVSQAHRLQRHSADRRVHGGRLHQGRVEDDGRDQEDSRSQDQAHRHLRARAGVRRPFRSGQYRVREADHAPTRRATILRNAPGCLVIDKHEPGGYVTPYECAGEDATYISRIREDATVENGLAMWVVSDNLRKGAALNAMQIAECLINRKLIQRQEEGGLIRLILTASRGDAFEGWASTGREALSQCSSPCGRDRLIKTSVRRTQRLPASRA